MQLIYLKESICFPLYAYETGTSFESFNKVNQTSSNIISGYIIFCIFLYVYSFFL